ncbi:MAG TPA: proton-conducting transporter membrane subunit [Solirubrobacter sp.]|nr:proton-conducting transporter membrane subunit [Solirubrobacter sp.]
MTTAVLSVFVPLGAACALAALAPFTRRRAGWTPVVVMAATAALLAVTLARPGPRLDFVFGGWAPRVGVVFAIDGIGGGLALFVAVLGVVALAVAARTIVVESLAFDALMLVFIGAMIGFCLTGDLFNLFVFFELMGVAAYVLVAYEVRRRAALEGALTFAVTNTVGSILLLFGIALLYGHTGALNLAQIGRAVGPDPATPVRVAFALLACGLLVKAAVVPFHLWTADAYAVAPTPVCILLAGAFSELGLYGLARVYWTVFDGALDVRAVLLVAGLLTAVVGAVMCAVQHHLKRMLAFATIAQVGLFLTGLGLTTAGGVAGTALWVVGDGLVKAGLFACVAILRQRFGDVEAADLHGRGPRGVGVVFVVGALAIASLPPSGPFLAKAVLEDAALAAGYPWLPAALLVVTGVVGGTLLRVAAQVFWGLGAPPPHDPAGEEPRDETARESERGGAGLLPVLAGALMAAGVAWGLVPGLRTAAGRAAAVFTDRHGYAAAVLGGRAPHVAPVELAPPGATAYLYAAGSLALALAVAAVGLWRGRHAPAPVQALRRLHNGRPGDYVAWTVLGAAILAAVFAF